MKYQNTKTGFVFDSGSECTGEDWVRLDSLPVSGKAEKAGEPAETRDEKPVKAKRIKKDGNGK